VAPDFRKPRHLPNVALEAANPHDLPRQRRGTTPQMHGRYPDFDCLEQGAHWDDLTRSVVVARVEDVPGLTFFTELEASTLTAFCDVLLAQDAEPRIPVLAFVDEKLAAGRLDGFRFDGMPDDPQTWRLVARGLDEAAAKNGALSYADATLELQSKLLDSFAAGELKGGVWETLPPSRAWSVVTRSVLAAFYSHPWAWNEIGFGGPAYPRGYARLGPGLSESWEGAEALDLDPGHEGEAGRLE
jgi:Gluconate 2-dehydrogenase subunit 3